MTDHDRNGDNGNLGHTIAREDAFEGARLQLTDLKRGDGLLSRQAGGSQQGVLNRFMSAEKADIDYRQELKQAYWLDHTEIDLACAAIDELRLCGCEITRVLDRIIASSAGENGDRMKRILDAYSHITINDEAPQQKKRWSGIGNRTNGSDSPLAQ